MLTRIRFWLRAIVHRSRTEGDMDTELRFHIEARAEDLMHSGVSRQEALRRARMEFGGMDKTKEECRETRGISLFESLLQDLRYGVRVLQKSPGFTAVAVLTLALGIGANTAIFSLIDSLMLRQLPVRDPGQLVELLHRFPGDPQTNGFSGEAYQLMCDHNHVFSGLIADSFQAFTVRDERNGPHTVTGGYVDGTFFTVLGLRPAIGRLLGSEDDHVGSSSTVAVLSSSYWKSEFNQDPAILGKQITVDGVPVIIVGVTPRGFVGLSTEIRQDLWLPLSMEPIISRSVLGWGSLALVGRLKPGVSIEQARTEMTVLFHAAVQLPNLRNPFLRMMKFEMEPAGAGLTSPLRQQYSKPLLVLMAIVGLLLLIACINVASMLLARGATRQHEMAVRVALGAGRFRLVRQALTESLLLSVAGCVLGVLLAYFGVDALVRIVLAVRQPGPPLEFHVRPDALILFFTAATALVVVLLSGLAPAFRAMGIDPANSLRQSGRIGESRLRQFFGKSLVVAQVALSVVLLSAATLFVHYLSNLERLDLGFNKKHLLLVSLDSSRSDYSDAQLTRLYQNLLDHLSAIPGVRSATLSAMTPISGRGRACYCVSAEDSEIKPENLHDDVFINSVAPNYFETYGTPLLAGRDFTPQDEGGPRVAIINQTMARYYFGKSNPIGKRLTFDLDAKPYGVIGVVGDAKYNDIHEAAPHTIYLDTYQEGRVSSQLTLRTSVAPEAVAGDVRRTIGALLKTVPVARVTTMDDQVDDSIVPERLIATLSGWFGALGALLTAIGLYGLLAYMVARRINEIGVRMALGATRSNVFRMVLRSALRMVCTGLMIGVPFALWAKSLAANLIEKLPVNGTVSIILGALAMIGVALLACYAPARRAMRVDPMVALRYE